MVSNKNFIMSSLRLFCLAILVIFRIGNNYALSLEKQDTVLLNKQLANAKYYLDRNPDSTYYFADKALKLSLKLSSLRHLTFANQYLGYYYTEKENFGKA